MVRVTCSVALASASILRSVLGILVKVRACRDTDAARILGAASCSFCITPKSC
ncbi:hypothetical protein PR001_g31897 [Phytophthora rubi]|uniref:RxLR effector protein n=1 Tax=Phytophthora rubi TaxID=129364 RepID=A0A6A3GHP4_9STRA|nr:hypothetical protein PR001_g31897 [Phytophthora rubi]